MKISASVRRLFDEQKEKNEQLKREVDKRITGFKDARWHYVSRVKQLSSFALKIESGRYEEPNAIEDFFACTLVVTNYSEIERAENLILDHFAMRERRPPVSDRTHKSSDSFPFDDLRLYLNLRQDSTLPPSSLDGITFECQIKTFLQHAWSIATHDLVYKTDDVSWSKERIAFQTKAMLEHAEVSIQEAERLATCSALGKTDERSERIVAGIALLKNHWEQDELPTNVRKLSENINQLIKKLGISMDRLDVILSEGKLANSGTHPKNLSPFSATLQYLFNAEREALTKLLESRNSKFLVLIPAEIEIPDDIDRAQWRNAIFVS